jgi:hypothetical protein
MMHGLDGVESGIYYEISLEELMQEQIVLGLSQKGREGALWEGGTG